MNKTEIKTAEEILRENLLEGFFESDIDKMKDDNETRWAWTLNAMEEYASQFHPASMPSKVFVPVPVSERLPDDKKEYIVRTIEPPYETHQSAWLCDDKTWECDGNPVENVTHWLEEIDLQTSNQKMGAEEKKLTISEAFQELKKTGIGKYWDDVKCICAYLDREKCSVNCPEYEPQK